MKINESYVQSLPGAANPYGAELGEGEKVLFAAQLSVWGDERDQSLGINAVFTLTNKKIVVDNGAGIWTIGIEEDIADIAPVTQGKWIFKSKYFNVNLYKPMTYNDGKSQLKGFHFYFKKDDEAKMETMVEHLFQ